jgi:hypothetical protein
MSILLTQGATAVCRRSTPCSGEHTMSQVLPLFIVLVVLVVVIQAILLWPRLKAEGLRLRLLQAQLADQPLHHAVLQAQVDQMHAPGKSAAQASQPASAAEGAATEPTSLLHRRRLVPPESSTPPASDPYWDALLHYADHQM